MDEREAFTPAYNREEPAGRIVYATGKDGVIFHHFELILPASAAVSRVSPVSMRVHTRRLSLQISVRFEGWSAVLPLWFEELYLRHNPDNVDAYIVGLDIEVKFAWWALFTATGWEYYRWLDSFIDRLNAEFSFSRFLEDISWNTALTVTMLERSRKTPPQPSDNTTG
jgi:hypothetical protein